MKKLIQCAFLVITLLVVSFNAPASAADLANGGKIFSSKCASCHMGGGNIVNPQKTLQKSVLEANGMYSLAAITTQVTNGKAAMPSFKSQLTATDIEDVASYVLATADKGW